MTSVDNRIPKIIHYCWFGKNKKSKIIKRCIRSWKKYCPDFQIIEWNEDNFDVECNSFCKSAYEAKKWAFVSDYVRLNVLYNYGGIYMDTDVELIKPLDDYLEYECFLGFQHENYVTNGLVTGAIKNHEFIQENENVYKELEFINNEDSSKYIVCQKYTTDLLRKRGLKLPGDTDIQIIDNICIFPPEYFCPYDHRNFNMNITQNTVAIHHFASSWWDEERKRKYNYNKRRHKMHFIMHLPNSILMKMIGIDKYEKLKKFLRVKRRDK